MTLGDVLPYPVPVIPVASAPCHTSMSSPPASDSPLQPPLLDQHIGDVDFLNQNQVYLPSYRLSDHVSLCRVNLWARPMLFVIQSTSPQA